jgi:high-affinity nickel-transport protein
MRCAGPSGVQTIGNLVAVLNDNFGSLGYLIVAIFVVSWADSVAVYQINRYDTIEVRRD